MLNVELQAEEEAKRTEEAKKREAAKAKEETPKEGDGLPRAAEEKPDAGGEAAGRELEALRVRAAELDDRLRRKGLRKAERNKIAEELAGVQARMQELSGGNLVLFSRGDGAQGRPALSPTKAALRDRLLLKIAQTAGIRIVRERSAQILGSARNAEVRRRLGGYMGESRYSLEETFPATEAERAEIERSAKAKGTWLKAPNGQDTKLTPKQWVTVRTRAFKEWFGDWEKAARIEKLRDSVPVEISGREIEEGADIKSYRKNAKEYGSRLRGTYLNRDTGKRIAISMSGINEVLSHDASPSQFKSIAAIPQMVENGIYIESRENEDIKKHPDVGSYDYFVCGLKIGGADYTAKIVVANQRNGERYYDHKLTQIEKGALLSTLSAIHKAGEASNTPLSEVKDKRLLSILQANSSKVVDGNGEPLVVWHGTDADVEFWAFDTDEESTARKEHVWSAEYPSGTIFATSDRSVAEYYGNRVIPLFVNLREPEIVNVEQGESLVRPFDDEGLAYYDEAIVTDGKDIVVALRNERNVKSATENVGTFDAGNPDIRYALSMAEQAAWDGVLDDYEAGRLSSRNSHTVLNRTPVVLARILSDDGKNPNLKIVIDRSILDKTTGKTPSKFTGEYHHISVKDLRGLLVNLDNPIAVFDSETIPGDKVVLTEIKDFETGENAVVALAIGTKRGYIAVNAVSSIHGRRASSLNKWLKNGKLRYCNTQKFPAAVGVRWGGYPQRAVPGGKSPQRSVSVGVQNPQAAAPSGNASLLTEDDFKDELGVVKVNEENRFSLSMMDDEAAEKVARERRRDGARKKSAKTAARTGSRWRQGQAGDVDFSLSKFLIQN